MKNLITRALSGLVYIAVIVFAVLYKNIGLFVFPILMVLAMWEFLKMNKLAGNKTQMFAIFAISIFLSLGAFFLKNDNDLIGFLSAVSATFVVLLSIALFFKKSFLNIKPSLVLALVYLALPFSLVHFWGSGEGLLTSQNLLIIFIVIWVNDTFAYLFGITLGKHKLMPSVSPKKSWEGFIGGALASLVVGFFVFRHYPVEGFELFGFEIFILIVIIAATFGDLVESKFKRQAGEKDSGKLIPGHGGVLDRLDSFIFALPVATLFFELIG